MSDQSTGLKVENVHWQSRSLNHRIDCACAAAYVAALEVDLAGELLANLVERAVTPVAEPVEHAPAMTPNTRYVLAVQLAVRQREEDRYICFEKVRQNERTHLLTSKRAT